MINNIYEKTEDEKTEDAISMVFGLIAIGAGILWAILILSLWPLLLCLVGMWIGTLPESSREKTRKATDKGLAKQQARWAAEMEFKQEWEKKHGKTST